MKRSPHIAPLASIALVLAGLCGPALAATPTTVHVEGALRSAGGGPVADGNYSMTFAIYDKQNGGTAVWSEGPATVKSTAGRFTYALGSGKPLDAPKLAALPGQWLGIKVGGDPELPRLPIRSVLFALHARTAGGLSCSGCIGATQIASGSIGSTKIGFSYASSDTKGGAAISAKSLSCTGCVKVAQLALDKNLDLQDKSLRAAKLTSTGDLSVAGAARVKGDGAVHGNLSVDGRLGAKQFIGDGSKLTGIKMPAGVCPAGRAVVGIDSAGGLKCAPAGGDLEQISGKTISNHFTDEVSGGRDRPIPDNNSNGLLDLIDLPDLGVAETIEVHVEISKAPFIDKNPADGKPDYDPTDLTVLLFPPTTPALPKLRSNVVDNFVSKPTVSQKLYPHYVLHRMTRAGSLSLIATYPTPDKPVSGDLNEWVGKNPKGRWRLLILDNGDRKGPDGKGLLLDGELVRWSIRVKTLSSTKVRLNGALVLASKTAPCDVYAKGAIRYSEALAGIQVCNGTHWWPRLLGTSKDSPGATCKDIKDKAPRAQSGTYWIDPDGAGKGKPPYAIYCDQQTGGGGWTMVAKVRGNDPTMNRHNRAQWYDGKVLGDCSGLKDENALCRAYRDVPFTDVMIRSLANPLRNLAWRFRDRYPDVRDTVRKFQRIFTRNRLFGAVSNLDYVGNPDYHRECASVAYGFHGADWTQTYNGYLGVKNGWRSGHAGGVFAVSLFNHNYWLHQPDYNYLSLTTMHCVTDFAIGGGYSAANSGDDAYAINAHHWGNGNDQTHNWRAHAVFVR